MPLSFWDWQPYLALPARTARILREPGIEGVFLKAGTLAARDGLAMPVSELGREVLASYAGIDVTLCYRAGPEFIMSFEKIDPKIAGTRIAAHFLAEAAAARLSGCRVRGLQLDFDCPTRLLGRYAALLRALRASLGQRDGSRISITALQSWLPSWRFFPLRRAVDFYVLLAYGERVPPELERLPPLVDRERTRKAFLLARLHGGRYRVGLPAYSPAFVYDRNRRLVSVESDLSLDALTESRYLRHRESRQEDASGGTRHIFVVTEDVLLAGLVLSRGWTIVLQEMTADGLGRLTRWAREAGGKNLEGVTVYRLQKGSGDTCLAAEAVVDSAGGRGKDSGAHLLPTLRQLDDETIELTIELINPQSVPNRFGREPALVELRVRDGEFIEADRGEFDEATWGCGFESRFARSSLPRATVLRFEERLLPGRSSARTGPVRVRKTGERFGLYLYGLWDSSAGAGSFVCRDFEIFPQPAEQLWALQGTEP
jgi:hypothetical protein